VNAATTAPAYPVARPVNGSDARFSVGLTLARHGYPPLRDGADLVRLQQALFSLIYRGEDR
jgi:hypothetical protein